MTGEKKDPLQDPRFRAPSIWQTLREGLFGSRRMLECIQVEVTSFCPGRCTYCPHTTQESVWNSRHMAPETFARLWSLMRLSERIHLQGWGEPFLHPRFMDFVRLARKAECSVSTTSCGLRMDERLAESIVASGLDIVAFSLVGTDEESNAPRAGVPFSRVSESIQILQAVRKKRMGVHLEIHLAYLMLASRMEAVLRLPDLMDTLDIHATVVSTLDYIAAPGMETEAFLPHETDKRKKAQSLLEQAAEQAAQRGRSLYFTLPSPLPASKAVPCRENATKTLYVDAEGNMAPCIYLNLPVAPEDPLAQENVNRRVFGSIMEQDPLSVWNSAPFKAFREALNTPIPDVPCRTCPKRFENDID